MKMKKALAIVTTVALVGASSVVVFAAGEAAENKPFGRTLLTEEQRIERQSQIEQRMTQALADGVITQEQLDSFQAGEFRGFDRRFGFEDGERPVLTEEQRAERQARMEQRLIQALAEGVITQEQFDNFQAGEIRGFGRMLESERGGERPVLTEEQRAERQARMEQRLTQALEDGVITQEHFDAVMGGEFHN